MTGAALSRLALDEEAAALVEAVGRSVVWVNAGDGHGSGVIWTPEGLVVTCDHVLGRGRLSVELADGRQLPAVVVGRDRRRDLAALQVAGGNLPAARVSDARRLRVGEWILAVGHPFDVRGAATLGVVSAVGGVGMVAAREGGSARELLAADVALGPGNSGGPLADMAGRVVGIACMVVQPGLALAVPSHVVSEFVASLRPAPARRDGVEWV
jgi:serine protease Do